MRMTVQDGMASGRRTARRNVHKMKTHTLAFEIERQRPGKTGVIVSHHHAKRQTKLLEFDEHRWIAHIAKMPDLIRALEQTRKSGRIIIVGIGKDGDAHDRATLRLAGWTRKVEEISSAPPARIVVWINVRRLSPMSSCHQKPDTTPVYMGLPHERVLRPRFWVALALTIPVFSLAMGEMLAPSIFAHINPRLSAWLQLVLTTPVFFWCGAFFIRRWWKSIRERDTNMFTLTVTGTGAAYFYSLAAVLFGDHFPHALRAAGHAHAAGGGGGGGGPVVF